MRRSSVLSRERSPSRRRVCLWAAALLAITTGPATAQTTEAATTIDSVALQEARNEVATIQDLPLRWVARLIPGGESTPTGTGHVGSSVRGASHEGRVRRAVVEAWQSDGRRTAEYYYDVTGRPVFAFETFEFFEHAVSDDAWRNFLGLPAWQTRTYFHDGVVVSFATEGEGAPVDSSRVAAAADSVRQWIEDALLEGGSQMHPL